MIAVSRETAVAGRSKAVFHVKRILPRLLFHVKQALRAIFRIQALSAAAFTRYIRIISGHSSHESGL